MGAVAITRKVLEMRAAREAAEARRAGNIAGGVNRWAEADPDEAREARRKGGAALHSPAALARRLAKRWPKLSEDERAEVRAILAEAGV